MSEIVRIGDRRVDTDRPERVRYSHVVKHLYARRQRWDLAVPGLPDNPRARARGAGCSPPDLRDRWQWYRVCDACRTHVLTDHERYYLPSSLEAVRTGLESRTHAVIETRRGIRELFVGDSAIQVFLQLPDVDGLQRLATALRDPPSKSDPTNEDFHKKAVRKLRDKASLGSGVRS